MEKLLTGLSVTVIGLLVVFVGLVILIGFIKLLGLFTGRDSKPKAQPAPKKPAPAPEAPRAAAPAQPGSPGDVLAAITAAINALWEGETGFVVRRVRRVSNAPVWNRAGREEQTYSRL